MCIAFYIQAVFIEGGSEGMTPPIELVRCKLTLFYTYWQMNEVKIQNQYYLIVFVVVAVLPVAISRTSLVLYFLFFHGLVSFSCYWCYQRFKVEGPCLSSPRTSTFPLILLKKIYIYITYKKKNLVVNLTIIWIFFIYKLGCHDYEG